MFDYLGSRVVLDLAPEKFFECPFINQDDLVCKLSDKVCRCISTKSKSFSMEDVFDFNECEHCITFDDLLKSREQKDEDTNR